MIKYEGIPPFAIDDKLCIAAEEISLQKFPFTEPIEEPQKEEKEKKEAEKEKEKEKDPVIEESEIADSWRKADFVSYDEYKDAVWKHIPGFTGLGQMIVGVGKKDRGYKIVLASLCNQLGASTTNIPYMRQKAMKKVGVNVRHISMNHKVVTIIYMEDCSNIMM